MIKRMKQAVFEWTGFGGNGPVPAAAAGNPPVQAAQTEGSEPRFSRDRAGQSDAVMVGSASTLPMRRELVIERIMELNPTASEPFLARFADDRLMHYMERLSFGHGPRGRDARWVRRAESRAAVASVREA